MYARHLDDRPACPDLHLLPPTPAATCADCDRELGTAPGPRCRGCQALANRDQYQRAAALPGICQGCGEETRTYRGFGLCCKG
jgi:hypothetical protein